MDQTLLCPGYQMLGYINAPVPFSIAKRNCALRSNYEYGHASNTL